MWFKQTSWTYFLRSRSTTVSESAPEEEKQRQDDGSIRAPSPLVHGRISSDESDAEGHEETIEFQSSAAHPKPLAVSLPLFDTLQIDNMRFPNQQGETSLNWVALRYSKLVTFEIHEHLQQEQSKLFPCVA